MALGSRWSEGLAPGEPEFFRGTTDGRGSLASLLTSGRGSSHVVLSQVPHHLMVYDALNVVNLAGAELARRRLKLLEAVVLDGGAAAWEGADYFLGLETSRHGAYSDPQLRPIRTRGSPFIPK